MTDHARIAELVADALRELEGHSPVNRVLAHAELTKLAARAYAAGQKAAGKP